MKETNPDLEKYRLREGSYGSDPSLRMVGAFLIPSPLSGTLRILSSGPEEWEHVSVSQGNRCPNWPEMCFIKNMFWNEEEIVIQYHPPKSKYINNHPFVLHMWKKKNFKMPLPPMLLV